MGKARCRAPLIPTQKDREILAFKISKIAEPGLERSPNSRGQGMGWLIGRSWRDNPNAPCFSGLLGPCARCTNHGAAKRTHEVAARNHFIIPSALTTMDDRAMGKRDRASNNYLTRLVAVT